MGKEANRNAISAAGPGRLLDVLQLSRKQSTVQRVVGLEAGQRMGAGQGEGMGILGSMRMSWKTKGENRTMLALLKGCKPQRPTRQNSGRLSELQRVPRPCPSHPTPRLRMPPGFKSDEGWPLQRGAHSEAIKV